MSYWGPCPTKVSLCPTYRHDVTPVAILQDGGLRIYSSSLTIGCHTNPHGGTTPQFQSSGGPRNSNVAAGGFCPRKTENSPGAFAPHFWRVQFMHPFFNFGPGGIAPGGGYDRPLTTTVKQRSSSCTLNFIFTKHNETTQQLKKMKENETDMKAGLLSRHVFLLIGKVIQRRPSVVSNMSYRVATL